MEKLKEIQKAQWMNAAAVNLVRLREKRRLYPKDNFTTKKYDVPYLRNECRTPPNINAV